MRLKSTLGLLVVLIAAAASAAWARQTATSNLKPQVLEYWKAWQSGPDAAAALYAKDAGLVFYDLEPLKYTGWNEYKAGVGPNILAKFDNVKFTVNDDVKTTMHGSIAWTTATVKADGALKGGAPVHVVARHTAIWEKRNGSWLIVHEHVSVPSTLPAPAAKSQD